jgi:hypothetical protein
MIDVEATGDVFFSIAATAPYLSLEQCLLGKELPKSDALTNRVAMCQTPTRNLQMELLSRGFPRVFHGVHDDTRRSTRVVWYGVLLPDRCAGSLT